MLRLRCLSKLKIFLDKPPLISNGVDKLFPTAPSTLVGCRKFGSSWGRNKQTAFEAVDCKCSGSPSPFSSISTLSTSRWTPSSVSFLTTTGIGEGRSKSGWSLGGGVLMQTLRDYHVNEGSIKWRRRRGKAMEQRKKVLNPNSPVINQRVPLPPHDVDKFPPELFGYQIANDPVKEQEEVRGVVTEINRQIESKDYGRLFAVINLKGKQFKVTTEDIIILQGYWAPNVGDRLRLHKVLLVGGGDFTLTGRPMVDDEMIRVEGTVIEKTLSYTKLHFRLKKRKNYRRLKFSKDAYTMLRINMIELLKPIEVPETRHQEEDQVIDVSYRVTVNK